MPRQKLVSVTIHDCKVDTFAVGGHGGSGKDTCNSGVRVRHEPSGASGEGRDSRSQHDNKRDAFMKMIRSSVFQAWLRLESAKVLRGRNFVEQEVERLMQPKYLRIETKDDRGRWSAANIVDNDAEV